MKKSDAGKAQLKAEARKALLSAAQAKARAAALVGGAVRLTEVPNHGRAARLKVGAVLTAKASLECRGRSYVRCEADEKTYTLSPAIIRKVK